MGLIKTFKDYLKLLSVFTEISDNDVVFIRKENGNIGFVKKSTIKITVDDEITAGSENPVQSKVIYQAIDILMDSIPVHTSELVNDSNFITANQVPDWIVINVDNTNNDYYFIQSKINGLEKYKIQRVSKTDTSIAWNFSITNDWEERGNLNYV